MAPSPTMSGPSICHEEVTSRMKTKLNEDKIKLWLPPYTTRDKKRDEGEDTKVRNLTPNIIPIMLAGELGNS